MEVLRRIPIQAPTFKKKSRLSYSINFKLAAVRHAEAHGNRATARYLGINEKQIRDWRSKKTCLMNTNSNAKRLKGAGRQVTDSKRDIELKVWIDKQQQDGKLIRHCDVQEKAKRFSNEENFKASSGWLRRWKVRQSYPSHIGFVELNNNYSPTPFENTVSLLPPPPIKCSLDRSLDREKEFRDRITCALALLDLKSPIIHKYDGA